MSLYAAIRIAAVALALCACSSTGPEEGLVDAGAPASDADTSTSFLRDEASLVIVFVSDEDDCSVPFSATTPGRAPPDTNSDTAQRSERPYQSRRVLPSMGPSSPPGGG